MDRDWQNSLCTIKDRGSYLLETQAWSDCRFLVGTTPNQKFMTGHKLILAMASPVFERMFFGQFSDIDDPILIPDVQPEAFKEMLKYIYSDSINISSFDEACKLFHVAQKYMLTHAMKHCINYLKEKLAPENACLAYEFATFFNYPRLMRRSMKLIADQTRYVLGAPNFTDIEFSTLMAILDQDKLNIDSEMDLFNAVMRFANERGIVADNTLQNSNTQNCSKLFANDNGGSLLDPQGEHSSDVIGVDSASSKTDAAVESEQQNFVATDDFIAATHEQPLAHTASMLNDFTNNQSSIIDEAMIRQAVNPLLHDHRFFNEKNFLTTN